jgi:hypothetical protein
MGIHLTYPPVSSCGASPRPLNLHLQPADPKSHESAGWQHWTVTGFDFSQSFTVTADLAVVNLNAKEAIKVHIRLGCTP